MEKLTSLRVRYNPHNQDKFDVFFLSEIEWKLYKTCDYREDYISELDFKDPVLNEYIGMRVAEMFD